MIRGQYLLLLFLLGLQISFVASSCISGSDLQTSERASQAVLLKFYRILKDEWDSKGHSAKVSVQVSTYASLYCQSNPSACGMETCCSGNTTFKDTNVGIVSGFPQNAKNKKDMELKIYLDLPSGANATGTLQCSVALAALQEIVGNARDQIHTETGSWITYVDDIFYGIPPASDLNRILIPVAFVILFLICLTALILHYWFKRQDYLERKRKIIEKRRSTQKMKTQPRYDVDASKPIVPEGISGKNAAREKPKRSELHYMATFGAGSKIKDELYKERLRHSNQSVKKSDSMISADSAIRMDTEPRQRHVRSSDRKQEKEEPVRLQGATNYAFEDTYESKNGKPYKEVPLETMRSHEARLAPINGTDDVEDVEIHKKKKKKKKHHKSKSSEVTQLSEFGNGMTADK